MARVTVHTGRKGGVEYRLHDDARGTFRCVSRYVARPLMDDATRATADAMDTHRRTTRQHAADDDATWRRIMRGTT